MMNIIVTSYDSASKVELDDDTNSTEMIERFCRILLAQTYQIGSLIDSLEEVRNNLIEEVKIADEDYSNK